MSPSRLSVVHGSRSLASVERHRADVPADGANGCLGSKKRQSQDGVADGHGGFAEYLAGQPGRYSRAIRLHLARRGPIRPEAADILVADLGERMRGCAGVASTHRVHLFLRTPFPIAVLLGRTLNTLEATLYEWDDTGDIPRYVKAATVAAGRGGGPVLLG